MTSYENFANNRKFVLFCLGYPYFILLPAANIIFWASCKPQHRYTTLNPGRMFTLGPCNVSLAQWATLFFVINVEVATKLWQHRICETFPWQARGRKSRYRVPRLYSGWRSWEIPSITL